MTNTIQTESDENTVYGIGCPDSYSALNRLIRELDLRRIIWKMADPEEGKGFTPQMLARAEMDYRRFLHLHIAYPKIDLVPTKMIDEVWHQHILDTRAYAADCKRIFGSFLHHYPYFGMNGDEDKANLNVCFDETKRVWLREFGEPMFELKAVRCSGHSCHAPSSCACRSPGSCK